MKTAFAALLLALAVSACSGVTVEYPDPLAPSARHEDNKQSDHDPAPAE